jgi:hypothetical protein
MENLPSITREAECCSKWIDSLGSLGWLETRDDRTEARMTEAVEVETALAHNVAASRWGVEGTVSFDEEF